MFFMVPETPNSIQILKTSFHKNNPWEAEEYLSKAINCSWDCGWGLLSRPAVEQSKIPLSVVREPAEAGLNIASLLLFPLPCFFLLPPPFTLPKCLARLLPIPSPSSSCSCASLCECWPLRSTLQRQPGWGTCKVVSSHFWMHLQEILTTPKIWLIPWYLNP